ncbi:hypothetical protein BDZ94DRAFT_1326346 [Collybia nuda]|uniref:DRBM domain-containing protein n=1 Tax=Collybia nuda TaxID=64659 RepID=A0A9P5XTM3_9AGAR|nr:hypothetical protein BDZ94DRAFT_1326346 [Collybia nuda]
MNELASAASDSSFITLKRTRPAESISRAPPLPKITSELILQVYTHISLRRASDNPEEYGDNERLITLGTVALDAAITDAFFNKRPTLKTSDLCSRRDLALSDANFETWVKIYGLKQKLRCHPDVFSTLDSPKEVRSIFYSYVGGMFEEHGLKIVREWISDLLEYDEHPPRPSEAMYQQRIETPPPKKMKSDQWSPPVQSSTIFFASQPPSSPVLRQTPPHLHQRAPSQPQSIREQTPTQRSGPPFQLPQPFQTSQAFPISQHSKASQPYSTSQTFQSSQPFQSPQYYNPPFRTSHQYQPSQPFKALQPYQSPPPPKFQPQHLKPLPSRPNPLAPAQPGLPFLPLFNQTATQRRVTVDYPAEFSGPPHAGRWTVKCVVNGIPKGQGSGSSKQIAKEEAARQAYYAMGWT